MKLSPTPTMSRDEAVAIYNDLQKAMNSMIKNVQSDKKFPLPKSEASPKSTQKKSSPQQTTTPPRASMDATTTIARTSPAHKFIGSALIALSLSKVLFSVAELGGALPVEATTMTSAAMPKGMSKTEIELLKTLDGRRVELEQRRERLDLRERELQEKERAFSVSLIELKDLTARLRGDRDKEFKKKEGQMAQLANVYGAMNPPEAAQLLDQLDTHTSLSLLERMPEKRIGQVLPLMKPERALMLTQMMSGRAAQK